MLFSIRARGVRAAIAGYLCAKVLYRKCCRHFLKESPYLQLGGGRRIGMKRLSEKLRGLMPCSRNAGTLLALALTLLGTQFALKAVCGIVPDGAATIAVSAVSYIVTMALWDFVFKAIRKQLSDNIAVAASANHHMLSESTKILLYCFTVILILIAVPASRQAIFTENTITIGKMAIKKEYLLMPISGVIWPAGISLLMPEARSSDRVEANMISFEMIAITMLLVYCFSSAGGAYLLLTAVSIFTMMVYSNRNETFRFFYDVCWSIVVLLIAGIFSGRIAGIYTNGIQRFLNYYHYETGMYSYAGSSYLPWAIDNYRSLPWIGADCSLAGFGELRVILLRYGWIAGIMYVILLAHFIRAVVKVTKDISSTAGRPAWMTNTSMCGAAYITAQTVISVLMELEILPFADMGLAVFSNRCTAIADAALVATLVAIDRQDFSNDRKED